MKLFTTQTCERLPDVSADIRHEIETAERSARSHRQLMQKIPALHVMETGGAFNADILPAELTVAAWNVERCLDPHGSADLLAAHAPDIVLLSEMDCGMARTLQANTTRQVAEHLDMGYAYGVEFYELGLGSAIEVALAQDDFNASGWHGNAILSRSKPQELILIRLDDHGHWFCAGDADPGQPRIGGRMAIAAIFKTSEGPICAVCTHLESAGNIFIRQTQMNRIMAAVDHVAPDMPVIIGGDLNTGNNLPDKDWRSESLFEAAERQGYSWSNNAEGNTTRPSRLTRFPDRTMKLDWFAHRDLAPIHACIVQALDANNAPLSDHELVTAQFSMLNNCNASVT